MNDIDAHKAKLAVIIKDSKENFSPVFHKELYTQIARDYKIQYDCYRKEGFTVTEALRLVARHFD